MKEETYLERDTRELLEKIKNLEERDQKLERTLEIIKTSQADQN